MILIALLQIRIFSIESIILLQAFLWFARSIHSIAAYQESVTVSSFPRDNFFKQGVQPGRGLQ